MINFIQSYLSSLKTGRPKKWKRLTPACLKVIAYSQGSNRQIERGCRDRRKGLLNGYLLGIMLASEQYHSPVHNRLCCDDDRPDPRVSYNFNTQIKRRAKPVRLNALLGRDLGLDILC